MDGRNLVLGAAAVLLIGTAAGCDFFSSSGPSARVSPFISDLQLSRSSVLCDQNFSISFRYEDLQEDIEVIRFSFRHSVETVTFEDGILWEDGADLDLSVPGRAIVTYRIQCDTGLVRGVYILEVTLEDARGHESNSRTATVDLLTT